MSESKSADEDGDPVVKEVIFTLHLIDNVQVCRLCHTFNVDFNLKFFKIICLIIIEV